MTKQHFLNFLVLFITIPLLFFLSLNQFKWFQSRQDKERILIEHAMLESVEMFSNRLYEELLFLPSILNFNSKELQNFTSLFYQRYNFWKYYSLTPEVISEIYFVDALTDTVLQWESDTFETVSKEKSLIVLQTPSIHKIPVIINLGNNDEKRYSLHCFLDYTVISKELIPAISKEVLVTNDLYAYRIYNLETDTVLYQSDPNDIFSRKDVADIHVPLFIPRKRPEEIKQQRPLKKFTEIEPNFLSLFSEQRRANFKPPIEEEIHIYFQKVIIQIYNKDGSLDHLAFRATIQNGILSFGVVFLLVLLMGGLSEANRRATSLAQRQSEFIATISHELKTPLAIIHAAAQNLSDGIIIDSKKISHYGSLIQSESHRLTNSINHFLVYAASNTPNKSKYQACDIVHIIQIVLNDTEDKRKSLQFRTEIDIPGEPLFVYGDPLALESVIRNLIHNVIIHAHQGKFLGIRLTRERKNKNSAEERIILKIRDRGLGIPVSEQKSVFYPFVRGKFAVSSQIPGNGIGLNIVKRIVLLHRGTITLESKQDRGCVFSITLPIYKGE